MQQYFPFLEWAKNYKESDLSGDLIAGLTVGVMLIPQGMAYAMLAGLPPIYGLYASTIPLFIYALFGTSRQLAVGPVAMVALLISSGVSNLAPSGSAEYIQLAILLALLVGIIQFSMGLFKLGFLVNFLSHPVIAGFTSAAAIIIGVSQLKHLLGFSIPRGKVHETLLHIAANMDQVNLPTLILGVVAIILLIVLKHINKRLPGPLIVVLLGILSVYLFKLFNLGVQIVKDVPDGLPPFSGIYWDMGQVKTLFPIALTISFVGFMESIAIAKAIQAKHKNYKLIPNQELIGLGLANIVGSLFSAFPTTGGFSRTAVNDQAGAKTALSSIISALLILITLLFFTSYFYYLPKAILASIILVAVFGLIDYKEALHLWNVDRRDFWLFMVTAVSTLAFGIEEGILIGVFLSLSMLIYRVSYPHMAELGRVPGTDLFRNIERFENIITDEKIAVLRFDAQLFFANMTSFQDKVLEIIRQKPKLEYIVIDAIAINNIDSSAAHMLASLVDELKTQGISLFIVGIKGPVRDILHRTKLFETLKDNIFVSVEKAVDYIKYDKLSETKDFALQSNSK